MIYTWSVLSGPPNAHSIALFLKNLHQSTVVFPSNYVKSIFAEGEEYTFSLQVQNHFHINSAAPAYFGVGVLVLPSVFAWSLTDSEQVSFDFDPIPTVTLNPSYLSNLVSTRVPISSKLQGTAVVSGCSTPFLEPRDSLEYSWIKVQGDSAVQVDLATTNTPQLWIPAGSFQAGKQYIMELRAKHTTYNLQGYSQAVIEVLQTPPYANIYGGMQLSLLSMKETQPKHLRIQTVNAPHPDRRFRFVVG